MIDVILSVLIGLFLSVFVIAGECDTDHPKLVKVLVSILMLLVITTVVFFGITEFSKMKIQRDVAEYKSIKYTYESAVQSENLGGLERLQIIDVAIEKNTWLADQQFYASTVWWFNIPQDIKDAVIALESIQTN